MMSSSAEVECKKLCVFRCFYAVCISIGVQYLLLAVFLLFVNFSIFHPINWITNTFGLVFSLYTWLCIMPLISAVIIYGIFLGNSYLVVPKYCPTRFKWIWSKGLKKLGSFAIHASVGFLTAWLYSRFLHEDYNTLLIPCFDEHCINSRYIFLAFNGIYAGVYYFACEDLFKDISIEFPIIQERRFVKIRTHLYSTLFSSVLQVFWPTVFYLFVYSITNWLFHDDIASFFGAQINESNSSLLSILNIRLFLYVWILSSQIHSNMHIIKTLFNCLLTEEINFAIEKNLLHANSSEITLIESLALESLPIVQKLASWDLYNLALLKNSPRRQTFFSLSVPGGHPYNWNQLSGQCLAMIEAYTEQLVFSIRDISSLNTVPIISGVKGSAKDIAEKVLLRQYNESFGIRKMMSEPQCDSQPQQEDATTCTKVNDVFDQIKKMVNDTIKTIFHTIPGLNYFFGEQEGAKTVYLLSKSQELVWIIEGIAGICVYSINEDKYGVVQNDLPKIIKALLKLRGELIKLNNLNFSGKKTDRNLAVLNNAVKRSLYKICTVFGDYVRDIIPDPMEYRQLVCFVHYHE